MTNKKQELFFALNKKFDIYHEKFQWWNGAEFGTLLGMIVALFTETGYWWLFGAFWVEFGWAFYYQHQCKKILKEMENLIK